MAVKDRMRKSICKFLMLGKSTSEISSLIGISETNVKNHLREMYRERNITVKHKRVRLVKELFHDRINSN